MKGFNFKKRAPLALWKVLMIVFASLIGLAGATALVLFLTGKFDEKVVDPQDMAFTQVVDGQGYADYVNNNNWYFLSDDSNLTISCTTEGVTETKVELSLRNGITRNGFITDGVITIPTEVELNKPFKVELVRRGGQIVGSVDGYSYITAKSQNILLPTKNAYIAVDTPVSGISLAVGGSAVARADEVQNVVVGSTFEINTIFNPSNSKYLFNNRNTSKRVFFRVLGSNSVNFISYTQNADGSYTFSADEVSGSEFSTVYAYAFSNSYFEKIYFDAHPNATADEIVAFMQNEENASMVVSSRTFIKVLDIEVDEVRVEPSAELAEVYVDKYFTLSTNSTEQPNDMSLGISIFDSGRKPAQVLLGRVGIKVPKGKETFKILGGRVMKVTTNDDNVTIEEEVFDANFDYSDTPANVEYYILPRTRAAGDYGNYYWSFASDTVESSAFALDVNFFFKDENGLWKLFFDEENKKSFNVIVKEGNNSVSLTADSLDLVINYDDEGKPIAADLPLTADIGNSIYTKVAYFLFDNTRDGNGVNVKDIFNCGDGVIYSQDYQGKNININGISLRDNYTFYELPSSNILTVKKSYTGSVVVVAALVRTDVNGVVQYQDAEKTRYQLVCFSGAKVVNVESTLSISNMTPTFRFADTVEKYNNQFYLPAVNKNEDGSTKEMIKFNLSLSSEDIAQDVEKLMTAYNNKSLRLAVCDRDGNEYTDEYLSLSNLVELEDSRTANMAVFEGTVVINEEFFSAGRNSVDRGRAISFKIVYNDGKETREKAVGMDKPATEGVVDYFYVYFQQPKEIRANYSSRSDISIANKIEVNISAGADGLRINWGNVNLTGASYADTISQLNSLLTFTMFDQFGQEISPVDGVYSVQFNEVRKDSNNVLMFSDTNGIPTSIADFTSTNGRVVPTDLKVFVVDRRNGNSRVMAVGEDGTFSDVELQSDLISFEVSTEGLDYIKYDKTTVVGNSEDDRFADADKNVNEVSVSKSVVANDTITLSDLFRIYTTNSTAANTDYSITFDGTWLQGFQGGNNGVDLKRMLQINGEDSSSAQENITAYENLAITTLRINAPFGKETTLQFRINSNNNLYSVSLKLVLSSDIEISQTFENYQTDYADYLTTTTDGGISVFADEIYDLDDYLKFKGNKFSWADAFVGKGVDLSSNINGVFYESTGIASLDTVVSGKIRLQIASVRQYTPIRITLYYGVRSEYAFSTPVALYVNPNIIIEEKVDSLDEYPLLDLTTLSTENISKFYEIYKATTYIRDGLKNPVSLGNDSSTLDIRTLTYVNKDKDGFIAIQNGSTNAANAGKFAYVAGKSVDILNAYTQEFSVYVSGDSILDAVKVKTSKNKKEIIKYSEANHISIGFSVCYNKAGIDELVEKVFPGATVISYDGQLRLLLLAGETYQVDPTFSIESVTGSYVIKNARGTELTARIPTFVSHDNTASVYSTVSDGTNTLQINIVLGVTVSNVGNEFVYYSNGSGFNSFNKFVRTTDMAVDARKTYYALVDGVYQVVNTPILSELSTYYEISGNVDFDKLVSENIADLEENDVYESLGAGKSYKILHDISTEYSLTKDEKAVSGKTYYQKNMVDGKEVYVVVNDPKNEQITTYYEKSAPEHGFYFNKELYTSNGANRVVSVDIVSTGVEGYIENLATYADGMLTINSMESDLAGYIVLKITLQTVGANVTSYSWYYRVKVLPNFEIGKVNYPYNEAVEGESNVFGEYLDTNSEYYNNENLTYSINLAEKFGASNSNKHSGTRFDDIKWIDKPEGTITEEYRTKTVSSGVSVSFDGTTINISYNDVGVAGSVQTVVIEKCWKVNGVEVVGSAMEYTFKLNQASEYAISLYRGEVKTEKKVGPDNQANYQDSIIAGSGEQVFIPVVETTDGGVTGGMSNFGSYVKGDMLDLLDALQFKKVWLAAGTEIKLSETDSMVIDHDAVIVDGEDWTFANVETREVDGDQKTYIVFNGTEIKELELSEDGYLWGEIGANAINGAEGYITCGVKLDDFIVEFLANGTQEYRTTDDKTVNKSKTYYIYEDGAFVEAEFEGDATFDENVTYYEKYRIAYKTIILNPKSNISKDSSFELGVYTQEGVVFKVALSAESFFEWKVEETEIASGKVHTFGDLISGLTSKDKNREILEVSLKLNNGADAYREYYFVTDDKERVVGEEYFILNDGRYQKVEFEEDGKFDEKVTYYEQVSLKVADIIDLTGTVVPKDGKLDLAGINLEIAPLVKDVSLDFDVIIKSAPKDNHENASIFTFSLPLVAVAGFDESEQRQVQDRSWRYGQTPFEVKIVAGDASSSITPSEFTDSTRPTAVDLVSTPSTAYYFVPGDGYDWIDTSTEEDKTSKVSITPENVSDEEQGNIKTLNVIGRFKGKEIARFSVKYRYSVAKNVIVKANYPTPDGVETNPDGSNNSSVTEYISATTGNGTETQRVSKDYVDFFNTSATFAMRTEDGYKHRIEAVSARRGQNGDYVAVSTEIEKQWDISISYISNVQVKYSTGDLSAVGVKSITSEDTDKVILEDSKDGKVNLNFTLLNTGAVGVVTFDIKVNKVLTQYTVTVINDSIVKVSTNTPNYNLNRETVFAEDLSKSEEQTLFTESRLLNYVFRSSAVAGAQYYVRLTNRTNPAENEIVPITVSNRGVATNIDLGKSYVDFDYTATFRTLEGAQANDSSYKISDDSELFTVAPNLTSRIVVTYFDGKPIKLDDTNYIMLGSDIKWTVGGNATKPTYTARDESDVLELYNPNSANVMSESGDIATFRSSSGTETVFTKVNPGDAFVGYFSGVKGIAGATSSSVYSGIILISKDKNALKVSQNGAAITGDQSEAITINGETWYVLFNDVRNFVAGALEDVSGLGKTIKLSGATWKECVSDLVEKSFFGYKRADKIQLTTDDYHKLRNYAIAIKVGDKTDNAETIYTDWQYNLYLDIEFGVSENADSASTYTTKTINAGQELSLFDEVDFGIYNTRTGNKYSNSGRAGTDSLLNSGGRVDLQIYGLSTSLRVISNGDDLQKVARAIHDELRSTADKDLSKDIVYETGIMPRAGISLTSFNNNGYSLSGSIDQNYITYSDVVVDGRKVDFAIRARGANNDGNHVMMRITYTVSFGDESTPIEVAHNLLIKVLPNARVSFLARQNSSASTASANLVEGGKSYASNKESPFAITNNDSFDGSSTNRTNEFYLWKSNSISESAVQAYLYGNTTLNNANLFDYSYRRISSTSEYNNFYSTSYNREIEVITNDNTITQDGGQKVYIKELKLGTRKFYIEAVNDFGFRIRFYFNLTATENPQISRIISEGNVLTEGQAVVVGAQYLPIAPTVVTAEVEGQTEYRQLLGTLTYQKQKENATGEPMADIIGKLPSEATKIVLYAQTITGFGTVTRSVSSFQSSDSYGKYINIWGSFDEWDGTTTINVPAPTADNPDQKRPQNLEQTGEYGLEGAIISVYAVFTNADIRTHENIVYVDAKRGADGSAANEEIKQPYSTSSGPEEPSVQVGTEANSDKARVVLRGISANAFKAIGTDSIHSLNTKVAADYISRVNDIKVRNIEYYLGDVLLGTSERGVSTGDGDVSLITSENYKFYDGKSSSAKYKKTSDKNVSSGKTYYTRSDNGVYTKVESPIKEDIENYYEQDGTQPVIDGIGYKDNAFDFLVPVIDSIYFGTNDTLPNVRMDITLVEGANTCVLSQYVTISKRASYTGFDGKTNILDNTAVENPNVAGQVLYNDTLEVVLDPGESVSFAISDKAFEEVPSTGLVELPTNNASFAVTKYVGISANIQNLDKNFMSKGKTNNNFYLTVVSQTTNDGIEFYYNGNPVTQKVVDSKVATAPKYVISSDAAIVKDKVYYEKDPTDGDYTAYRGEAFFKVATLPFDSEKVYYTRSEDGLYTVTTNVDATNIGNYYEQNNDRFYHEEEAVANSGKTYYNLVDGRYEIENNPSIGTKYKVATDRYELAYKRTSDRSIDRNKTYYAVSPVGIYSKVDSPVLKDIASYYEAEESVLYTERAIEEYSNSIILHINDVSEVGGGHKTETLFFLYQGGNSNIEDVEGFGNTDMYYQMSKAFSVFPQFEKLSPVSSSDTDTSGNIEFKVNSYMRAYRSSTDYYYIIPRAVWGAKLNLERYSAIGGEKVVFNDAASNPEYMFDFEINQDIVGGAGGAFIDESGNIITDKNFNLQESTITVNVYMKVSGRNGFYDVHSIRLKLGTFRMMLDAYSTTTTRMNATENPRYRSVTVSNFASGVVAVPTGYALNAQGSISGTNVVLNQVNGAPFGSATQTVACEVGDTLDFAELFMADAEEASMHNITYHIVEDKLGDNTNIVHYNNLNTYTIEGEGTHELTIIVSYRTGNASTSMSYGIIKLNVMAYNVLNRKDNVILVDASVYGKTTDTSIVSGKEYFTLTEDGKYVKVENPVAAGLGSYYDIKASTYKLGEGPWYAFDEDGSVKLITNESTNSAWYTAPVETGIYNESYVSLENGVTKVNSYTFYVVSPRDSEQRRVVLNQNAPYNLSNLFDKSGYRFYKVNGDFINGSDHTTSDAAIFELSTENFTYGANSSTEGHYIVRSPEGEFFRLTVNYKFTTSNSPVSSTIFIKQGESLKDAVEKQVKADLNNDNARILSVELIGRNGLLSDENQVASASDFRIDAKDYVIAYSINGATARYVRYSMTFYVYKDSADVTITTEPTTNYSLNSAGGDILEKLNLPKNASVEFNKLNESDRLVPVSDISLATLDSGNIKESYIVFIRYSTKEGEGENETVTDVTEYYLINLTFALASANA